jgi:hypothetical protein
LPDLRNLTIISASIFIFLFLLGILSGNMFTVILVRSITGTLFFISVIAAAFFILKKIVTDIPSGSRSGPSFESDHESDMLDIVIDSENPYVSTDSASPGADENPETDYLNDTASGFVEEVEEESIGDISFLDTLEDTGEIVEVMNDSGDISQSFKSGSLPSIDNDPVVFDSSNVKSSRGKGNDTKNVMGDNLDPGIMAKAIKTILTRDDKG